MKDEKDNKDDLIVDIDESQLALPIQKTDDDLIDEPLKADEKPKVDIEAKRERKRHNQDAIDALTAQLKSRDEEIARERQARIDAEKRAKDRDAELEDAKGRVAQSEYDRVQGYIATAKAREDNIKRAIQAANEVGDHAKVADLQVELAEVAVRKLQAKDDKVALEHQAARDKEKREAAPVERPEPQAQNVDPFEARISGLSRPSQDWLREHPECVTDDATNAKVLWAHKDAQKKGIRIDSREYFDHLENLMGFADQNDDADDEVEVDTPRTETRRTMPSAPVSRDTRMGQVAPGKYRLSREEAEMAEAMGMTPTQYAKNKVEMIKSGQWRD